MKGIKLTNLNNKISPVDDFYDYATGGWRAAHPLQGEYARFGMFDLLRENNRQQLHDLITGLADTPDSRIEGTVAQKVSDLYAMGMDYQRRNADGNAPLMPYIEKVKAFRREDLWENIAWLHSGLSGGAIFGSGVSADPIDSNMNIMHIGETGLGLGDRDYYLEHTESNAKIIEAYKIYIKRLMELIGYTEAEQERVCSNVMDIETKIARIKMTREERRDPMARHNKMTLDEISQRWTEIDFTTYFKALGVGRFTTLNVLSMQFFDGLNMLIPTISNQALEDYLVYSVVGDSTGVLSDDFYDAAFEMYDRVMSGKEEKQPLWKRAMAIPSSMLGEAVGKLYVEKHFPQANKQYMIKLVDNLRKALATHISGLTWMSDSTKQKALEKLKAMKVKIGYPDKWKDYTSIKIDSTLPYLENVLSAAKWYIADNYSKLGKPVDKTEWHMTPQTVNAYYSPLENEICFPAGILQPPYFDPEADDALNYGAIGVVIGHEMTHGFDDQGRKFDKNGNLSEWWSKKDADRFKVLADRLVAQFDAIEVAPGVNANGTFTLGENIADQGGLRIALTAYKNRDKKDDETQNEPNDGFTPLQRFYLSYASVWASNIREEEILVRNKTDPHSLERLRVNATLQNIVEFQEAFGIKEGDAMYQPANKMTIIW